MEAKIDETFTREGDAEIQWFDAKCLAVVGDLVVTSPNVDYVPYLTLGRSTLVQRADGRLGPQDFSVMPQKFSINFPHCGLIPWIPRDRSHRAAPLWLTPGGGQHVKIPGTSFEDVGNCSPDWVKAVEPLVKELDDGVKEWEKTHPRDYLLSGQLTNLKQALSRLKYNPYTYRDMVNDYAYLCRCAHDVHALLKYVKRFEHVMVTGTERAPAIRNAVGTWTDDAERVQFLLATGIPVWFVRSKLDFTAAMGSRYRPNVQRVTKMAACPAWVMQKLLGDKDGKALPTPVLYEGLGGDAMHIISRRHQFISPHTSQALRSEPPAPDVEAVYDERTYLDVIAPINGALSSEKRDALINARLKKVAQMPGHLQARSSSAASSSTVAASSAPSSSSASQVGGSQRTQQKKGKGKRAEPYPTPKAAQNTPRDKWVDPDSSFIPPSIPPWQDALLAVDRRPERLEPNRPRYNGYHFPEPALFVTTRNSGQYLLNWLASRQAWLAKVTTGHSGVAITGSPQMWREFLGAKHDSVDVANTFTARCRQQTLNLFGVNMEQPPSTVYWQEVEIMTSDLENPQTQGTMREVVWDAFEHSFRFELRALDRLACPEEWERDPDARDAMVGDVFGGNFLVASMPTKNKGLAAEDYRDRVSALEAIRTLMASWKNAPASVTDYALHPDDPALDHPQTYLGMEEAVCKFYCQTFFNWYARPPVVPHRIPQCVE